MIDPWKNFLNILGHNFSGGINDITAGPDEAQPCEYHNLSGVRTGNNRDTLAPGIYVVSQGNRI